MCLNIREAAIPSNHHILILVENLPVPFDRRVWQESKTLIEAGYQVSVICPKGKGYEKSYEVLDGVHIYRHALQEARSASGYFKEYFLALFHQIYLSFRVRRRQSIDAIQACNPPDLMFLVALVHKILFGTSFVFDHHDLSPELYVAKFGRKDTFHRWLCFFERQTFRMADVSIATNETFRDIAVSRGGMAPDRVVVVKSYPEESRFQRTDADPSLVVPGKQLIGYLGIMGEQDGVETMVRAVGEIIHIRKRDDVHAVIIGDGPELGRLKKLAADLHLGEVVRFSGYQSGQSLMAHLSAINIGIIPDPPNEFNDNLSMNKVFEYMMLGLPIVQFNLRQARRDAAEAAFVIDEHSPEALADGILALVDDPQRCAEMSALGQAVADREFQWANEARRYLTAYRTVFRRRLDVNDKRHYPAS